MKRISGLIYEETRGVLKIFLENVRTPLTYLPPLSTAPHLSTLLAIMTNTPLIFHRSFVTRYVSPMAPPLSVPDIH